MKKIFMPKTSQDYGLFQFMSRSFLRFSLQDGKPVLDTGMNNLFTLHEEDGVEGNNTTLNLSPMDKARYEEEILELMELEEADVPF